MRISGRLRLLVMAAADEAIATKSDAAGDAASAFFSGAYWLKDELDRLLDFSEFEVHETEERSSVLAQTFCVGYCAHSRTTPPGHHARCADCPMRPITVDRVAAQVRVAVEES